MVRYAGRRRSRVWGNRVPTVCLPPWPAHPGPLPRPVVHATLDTNDYDPETREQEVLWIETSFEYQRLGYATELIEKLAALGWNIRLAPGTKEGARFIDSIQAKHPDWF